MTFIKISELNPKKMPSPDIETAYQAWGVWCNGQPMPKWNNTDLFDIPARLIPYTAVLDVVNNPLDFVYRFWGTSLANIHHKEMKGHSVNDISPHEIAQNAKKAYNEIWQQAKPSIRSHSYVWQDEDAIEDFILRLPISDNGKDVDKIITIIDTPVQYAAYQESLNKPPEAHC